MNILFAAVFLHAEIIELLKEKDEEIYLKFTLPEYKIKTAKINGEKCNYIKFSNQTDAVFHTDSKGFPDLPYFTQAVILPDRGKISVEIVDTVCHEIPIKKIIPSKGPFTRRYSPVNIPYIFGNIYNKDTWYPNKSVSIGKPFIQRDFRGAVICFQPFSFNGKKQTLKLFFEIIVKIHITGKTGLNEYINSRRKSSIDAEFHSMYSNNFINFSNRDSIRIDDKEGKLLILSHSNFLKTMDTFVEWKKRKGIETDIIDISKIGKKPDEIRTYIKNEYRKNDNNLKYVLLVGDIEKIPSFKVLEPEDEMGLRVADNLYTHLDGDDHYPEIFIGRFSGNEPKDIATQVNRTIYYERDLTIRDTWLSRALIIGDAAEEEDKYTAKLVYRKIKNNPYKKVIEALNKNSSNTILSAVNNGVSIVIHSGHSAQYSGSNGFTSQLTDKFENVNKLHHAFIIGCWAGDFNRERDCFAESLQKMEYKGKPVGTVGSVMSSISQSWWPPYWGLYEFSDILSDADKGYSFGYFASQSFTHMLMKKRDTDGLTGDSIYRPDLKWETIADTWIVFGDPSCNVRTKTPEKLEIIYPEFIHYLTSQITVTSTPGATVSINNKINSIQKSAVLKNGIHVFNFNQLYSEDTLFITGTKPNYTAHKGTISIIRNVINTAGISSQSKNDSGLIVALDPLKNNVSFFYRGKRKLRHFDLTVFDMKGRIVYQTEAPNNWDLLDYKSAKKVSSDELYLAVLITIDENGRFNMFKKTFLIKN
ncbi:MAG: C25 family cysteine peptidase [Chitinispirillia bacterium]